MISGDKNLTSEQILLLGEIRRAISEHMEMERTLTEARLEELFKRGCTCPLQKTGRQQYANRVFDAIEDLGGAGGIPEGIATIRRHHVWTREIIQTSGHYKTLVITTIILTFLGACGTLIMGWGKLMKILNGG